MIGSRLILLVEDNPDDAELTVRGFEQSKMVSQIVVVPDGEQALDYLFATGRYADRDPKTMPDVVLLDLDLPKIDGLGVLHRMRFDSRTRRLPVVVLTSSAEESDIIGCYDLGANSFVQKPVDFARFLNAAQQLGMYWLDLNEAPPCAGRI